MKKILIKLVAMVLMMSFLGVPTSFASEEISVKINGETLIFDVPPQIVDGRTMVHMRTIFEALGTSIEWDGETKTITAKKAEKTIKATIGKKEISINEKITEMDVAPVIIDSRTLVPARFVAEALGAEVSWDEETKTVNIFQKNQCEFTYANDGSDDTETVVLDYGKCGEDLNWELLSDGTLHIFGTGPMYDYVKYSEPSPWYRYRCEPYLSEDGSKILNPPGSSAAEYMSASAYYNDNPKGWHYNRIVIDEGVTYIGNWAFYRVCVDELTIPEGVEATGHFAIRYSPTLKKVNLPDSLVELGDFGISRNQVLTTVNIGNGLKWAGKAAFADNPSLNELILPDTCVSINEQLNEPYGNINYTNQGFISGATSLKKVDFGSVTIIPNRTCINNSKLEYVVIPNTVEKIEQYAFFECRSLKQVVFEEGSKCKIIEKSAFRYAPIEKFVGCTVLEKIENLAFGNGWKTLKEFTFSDTNKEFPAHIFSATQLSTATIGSNVSVMSPYMFFNSAIEEIHISGNVTEFGSHCLYKCTLLTNIYYDGSPEDWTNITKGDYWSYQIPKSCVIHFADGTNVTIDNCKHSM